MTLGLKMLSILFRLATGLSRTQKRLILLAIDMMMIPVCLTVALALQGGAFWSFGPTRSVLSYVGILVAAGGIYSILLGLPRIKLNAYEQQGILRTIAFAGLVGLTGALLLSADFERHFTRPALVVFTMALIIGTVASRLIIRQILLTVLRRGQKRLRLLIYGAGQTGIQLVSALSTDPAVEPVCFVDDDESLHRMNIAGIPVFPASRIGQLVEAKQIDRVVLAMPSISRPRQVRIAQTLKDQGVEVRTLPSFADLVGDGGLIERLPTVQPDDFLNRTRLERELEGMGDIYAGQSVLISGAGGSIGSELCRQILLSAPRRLVLVETNELALYQIERELVEMPGRGDTEVVPVLGSVTDEMLMRKALAQYEVRIVVHAAAYKHLNMVERNQLIGLRNNVFGTKVLADAAREAGVTDFILISTDKAVRPQSVMGASKRLAELILLDLATRADPVAGPRYSIVRFGNVLGSSGSVVPLFEDQIARGGPVTLTHAEVTRFFMTTGEAVRLVLLAGSLTRGGELFVLDMGSPVSIQKLARQMIETANYTVRDADNPSGDIEIVITGLRPGEKLHEELTDGRELVSTRHPKILRAQEAHLSEIEVATCLRALRAAIESGDTEAALATLRRWVPGFGEAAPIDEAEASRN